MHIYGSRDGDRGDYESLKKKITTDSIQNVFLHPETDDVYSEYCESDIYVMSSRVESFGLVLIEAMACGLPIVTFDCKYGPRSIVENGLTGIIVPQNNIEKLAEAICSMIENEEMRNTFGSNARLASRKYLPDATLPLWNEFYKSL